MESYEQGDFDRAITGYTECIAEGTSNTTDRAIAHYMRGRAQLEMGSIEAAIHDYNHAIRLNPNYAEAYGDRGYAFYSMGQPGQAIGGPLGGRGRT